MRVLTVFAHPDPQSFCRAVLDRFTVGLQDAGHTVDVVDLYRIGFNPAYGLEDFAFFAHDSVPLTVLKQLRLEERVREMAGRGIRGFLARRWLEGKDLRQIARMVYSRRPKDVQEQQDRVRRADALAFISPLYWLGFPAIMKGWVERVFTYGFAYELTESGWEGDVRGRVPLLQHRKALIINTTFFRQQDYEPVLTDAIRTTIDSWGFRYPGIDTVEHRYFWAVRSVDPATRTRYLDEAYRLGADFDRQHHVSEAC